MRDYYIHDTTAKKWSAELKYTGKSVYATCGETLKQKREVWTGNSGKESWNVYQKQN